MKLSLCFSPRLRLVAEMRDSEIVGWTLASTIFPRLYFSSLSRGYAANHGIEVKIWFRGNLWVEKKTKIKSN